MRRRVETSTRPSGFSLILPSPSTSAASGAPTLTRRMMSVFPSSMSTVIWFAEEYL
jgi:hypothetical protein